MSDQKPRVLILGGCGFIARHLVKYLVEQQLCSKIRVADKQLPQTSYLSAELKDIYLNNPIVEFKQANLSNPAHVTRAFTDESGPYEYIVNLAAETRYGLEESVYKQMVLDVSVNCAKEALKQLATLKKYIEFSTAQVYEADKKASKESDKIKPWTKLARFKHEAEDELKKLRQQNPTFPLVIVRPAIVYGPGDLNGLAPRIICAATYTATREKMKLLWSGDLRINCVHVSDVARAIWHLFMKGEPGSVFNLADKSDLTQDKFSTFCEQIFGIQTGFWGTLLSQAAKLNMKNTVETANEQHMEPWSEMLKESGINSTPLSPYLDIELLYNTPLAVDGSAIEKTGFEYKVPQITRALVEEEIAYYQKLKLFPNF